jgi:hypothetical protein
MHAAYPVVLRINGVSMPHSGVVTSNHIKWNTIEVNHEKTDIKGGL